MNHADLTFRPLTFEEFQTLVYWASLEGWNPGLQDAQLFWATDPEGFYGYFEKETLIAGGSLVSYDAQFGFMGFFIVRPEYRAQGIGRTLWYQRRNTLLSRLHPEAAIGMDGVVAMQPFYQKGGFTIAYRDERYEMIGSLYPLHPSVQPVSAPDWPAICALDLQCFGVGRQHFLKLWLEASNAKAFKYSDTHGLQGFAVIRKCQKGYKIGPLFAKNAVVAEALYERCLSDAVGEPVYLDIPVCNAAAVALVAKYKATYVFECARMYYGKPPQMAVEKVYGLTSFELG